MTNSPPPLDARAQIGKHLATFNLFREADHSIHVTIADARGVAEELGDSGAPLHACAMIALRAAVELRAAPALPAAVPREPTEAMWNGLARAIMMWIGFAQPTPRKLFAHLKASGREIPQWLRDEEEMQALDHVPSKGTRCVIIWKAMYDAASPIAAGQGEGESDHA